MWKKGREDKKRGRWEGKEENELVLNSLIDAESLGYVPPFKTASKFRL